MNLKKAYKLRSSCPEELDLLPEYYEAVGFLESHHLIQNIFDGIEKILSIDKECSCASCYECTKCRVRGYLKTYREGDK